MPTAENYDGPLNSKVVIIFMVLGALGAIFMSYISVAAMVGTTL